MTPAAEPQDSSRFPPNWSNTSCWVRSTIAACCRILRCWETYGPRTPSILASVQDVLITPHRTATAAGVASIIPEGLGLRAAERARGDKSQRRRRATRKAEGRLFAGPGGSQAVFRRSALHPGSIDAMVESAESRRPDSGCRREQGKAGEAAAGGMRASRASCSPIPENFTSLERYIALAGLIYWVSKLERPADCRRPPPPPGSRKMPPLPPLPPLKFKEAFDRYQPFVPEIIEGMFAAYAVVQENAVQLMSLARADKIDSIDADEEGYIFQISLNRAGYGSTRPIRSGRKGRCRALPVQGELQEHRLGGARFRHRRQARGLRRARIRPDSIARQEDLRLHENSRDCQQ